MSLDHALYAIEDILGGHCAVANFAIRALIDIATRPRVQTELRAEIRSVLGGADFSLADKKSLTYLQATFYETVRYTCSAIVPHVANRNTSIAGWGRVDRYISFCANDLVIKKGTKWRPTPSSSSTTTTRISARTTGTNPRLTIPTDSSRKTTPSKSPSIFSHSRWARDSAWATKWWST